MQDLGDQRDPLRSGDDRAGTGAADNAPAETQAQMAYRIIEEMIVTLRLAPGSLVSEKSMSNLLGIGRTPIREALQRLAFEGTVRILPRAGVIVSAISPLCADAYNLLADEAATPAEARDLYLRGLEAGELALGPEDFEEYGGQFWGFLETRPYMRARHGLALALQERQAMGSAPS